MGNLDIWESVKHVDSKYTKEANVEGNRQTSISTLYPVKQITAAKGPIGGLWDYHIVSERMDNTRPMMHGGEFLRDGDAMIWEQLHTIQLCLKLRDSADEEWRLTAPQFGHTKFRYMSGAGKIIIDHEYAKKSVSDALKKCLSLLGVCADIYMGDFDDAQYKAEVQDKLSLQRADKNSEEELKQYDEMKAELEDALKAFEQIPNEQGIQKVYAQKARYFKNRLGTVKFKDAAQKCLISLQKSKDEAIANLPDRSAA